VNLDVGEVRFECRKDGQPLKGYQFVATQSIPGSISWNVYFLSGYIAPPDGEQMAEEVMNRIASSFKFEQNWFMAQVGGSGNTTDSPDW